MRGTARTPEISPNRQYGKAAADPGKSVRWSRRRNLIFLGITLVIIVLSLSLGLGLGLGLKHANVEGSGTPTPTATSSSNPAVVWRPPVNASWQIILSKTMKIDHNAPSVAPDVDVFDIDLFLHQNNTVIDSLHKLGKKVICYFSAGSYEPNRPDSSKFALSDLGSELGGWPGEYWLNIKNPNIRNIMAARIEIASRIGCDAIDPDNVDGFQNSNGLGLTSQDSINFMQFLAAEASSRKLGIGLKNAGSIIPDVLSLVQFSVNEQCAEYTECETFASFIKAAKPVFHIEYPESVDSNSRANACSAKGADQFSTVLKHMNLDGWVEYCDGQSVDSSVAV